MNALEVAKKMEIDSIKFYTEASAKTKYPVGKKMFETVIEDEKRHLEMVNQLINGMHFTVKDVSPMKRVKTVFESLKDHMIKKVEASKDEMAAFKIAMQMEKEGEAFYQESLAAAKTDKAETLFQRLIERRSGSTMQSSQTPISILRTPEVGSCGKAEHCGRVDVRESNAPVHSF